MIRAAQIACVLMLVTAVATAHEVRPALLKVTEVSDNTYLVHWKVPALGQKRMAIDPVFAQNVRVVDEKIDGYAKGASVRTWNVTAVGGLADTDIAFANLPSTMIDVLVQITFLDGRYYTGLVRPSAPVFHIPARDAKPRVFVNYLSLGVEHILLGWDHLLFVLGMVLLVTNYRRLFWAVTGFTAAHSITLVLSTLEVIRVPGPPVEALIALSIVFLAVEVSRYQRTEVETLAIKYPGLVSMCIGLIHGLGFAGALSEYGLPAHARFVSLLSFNLGVEAGQILFITGLLGLAVAGKRLKVPYLAHATAMTAAFIGICGSFWLVQRVVGFF
jgi:hydrogenase/urease accessory protein HupE